MDDGVLIGHDRQPEDGSGHESDRGKNGRSAANLRIRQDAQSSAPRTPLSGLSPIIKACHRNLLQNLPTAAFVKQRRIERLCRTTATGRLPHGDHRRQDFQGPDLLGTDETRLNPLHSRDRSGGLKPMGFTARRSSARWYGHKCIRAACSRGPQGSQDDLERRV